MTHHVSVHDHLRQKRAHKQKRRLILYSSFFISVLIGIFYFLFFSGYCDIRGITVSGAETIRADDVSAVVAGVFNERSLFLFSNKNFLVFPAHEAARAVKEKFPAIDSIDVSRKIWGANVAVAIAEREPVGIVCGKMEQDACMYLDKGGVVFAVAPRIVGASVLRIEEGSLGEITGFPAQKYAGDAINFIMLTKRHVREKAGITIKTFAFLNEYGDVEARTQEGFTIWFSMNQDAEYQAQVLKNLLAAEIKDQAPDLEYIDLRVENRAYYKLK
ncbi:hypothetical protein HY839_03675 [Candidatus Azambacteria bacterium]|nr:hypothetical protein [Candidatus Azambacteria bacterium]